MRIALLTTGPRPVARAFHDFPGTPVGIVEWDAPASVRAPTIAFARAAAARTVAFARGRRFATLSQLCASRSLDYIQIDKRDPEALRARLARWRIDLVVTSGCSLVPMAALADLSAGAINLHPSHLPAWRGANPLFWQIAADEPTLTASVHRLASGSDTGALLGSAARMRPRGASRGALLELADGALGVPLLRRTVQALSRRPDLPGTPQPATSPTPYARAVADVAEALPLDGLAPHVAWDVMRYLGHCPPGWLTGLGERTRTRWRALGPAPTRGPATGEGWRVERRGPTMRLVRGRARLTLVPRP